MSERYSVAAVSLFALTELNLLHTSKTTCLSWKYLQLRVSLSCVKAVLFPTTRKEFWLVNWILFCWNQRREEMIFVHKGNTFFLQQESIEPHLLFTSWERCDSWWRKSLLNRRVWRSELKHGPPLSPIQRWVSVGRTNYKQCKMPHVDIFVTAWTGIAENWSQMYHLTKKHTVIDGHNSWLVITWANSAHLAADYNSSVVKKKTYSGQYCWQKQESSVLKLPRTDLDIRGISKLLSKNLHADSIDKEKAKGILDNSEPQQPTAACKA